MLCCLLLFSFLSWCSFDSKLSLLLFLFFNSIRQDNKLVYKIVSTNTLDHFDKRGSTVCRKFEDFAWLHERLEENDELASEISIAFISKCRLDTVVCCSLFSADARSSTDDVITIEGWGTPPHTSCSIFAHPDLKFCCSPSPCNLSKAPAHHFHFHLSSPPPTSSSAPLPPQVLIPFLPPKVTWTDVDEVSITVHHSQSPCYYYY